MTNTENIICILVFNKDEGKGGKAFKLKATKTNQQTECIHNILLYSLYKVMVNLKDLLIIQSHFWILFSCPDDHMTTWACVPSTFMISLIPRLSI